MTGSATEIFQKNNDNFQHLCHSICDSKNKTKGKKEIVISIIQRESDYWNRLGSIIFALPLILVHGVSRLYLLIKDTHEELESFIQTGKTNTSELHVFSKKQEQRLIGAWKKHGLTVTHKYQQMEYMGRRVTIVYLKVRNPKTGVSISMIPWFMLPGRPFPVFVYIYSVWHYHKKGEKSLKESAAATGKLFGITSLNKSTVSRTIKAMENFIDVSLIDEPPGTDEQELPSDMDVLEYVQKILKGYRTVESLEEEFAEKVKQLPVPVRCKEAVIGLLSGIRDGYAQIIKTKEPVGGKSRDYRKRPARPRNKNKRVQRPPDFVDDHKLGTIRKGFIAECRKIILGATAKYHRFLF